MPVKTSHSGEMRGPLVDDRFASDEVKRLWLALRNVDRRLDVVAPRIVVSGGAAEPTSIPTTGYIEAWLTVASAEGTFAEAPLGSFPAWWQALEVYVFLAQPLVFGSGVDGMLSIGHAGFEVFRGAPQPQEQKNPEAYVLSFDIVRATATPEVLYPAHGPYMHYPQGTDTPYNPEGVNLQRDVSAYCSWTKQDSPDAVLHILIRYATWTAGPPEG
jgi:hypothetical protein